MTRALGWAAMSKVLTTAEVAARFDVTPANVRLWCRRGLLPNAYELAESRGSVWMIPEGDLKGFESPKKTGRPPKNPADTTRELNSAFKKAAEANRLAALKRATGTPKRNNGTAARKSGGKKGSKR